MKKYPKELFSSIRKYKDGQTKTFSVEGLFARGNEVAPLIPPGYSRLKVSIFANDGGVNGNIRETEIESIYEASKVCLSDCLFGSKNNESVQTPFFAGRNKGKTPAQVLLETNDLQVLREERKFLSQNADKFPRNKEVIKSIDEAAQLYKEGKLTDVGGSINIYHSDSRSIGKEDEEGMKKVYGIDINYFGGKFTIEINNYKAPVSVAENGSLRVKTGEGKDFKKMTFDMDWQEWIEVITKCKNTADAYNRATFRESWQQAERMETEEKQNFTQE